MKEIRLMMVIAIAILIAACGGADSTENANSTVENSTTANSATTDSADENTSNASGELAVKIRDEEKNFVPVSSYAFQRDMKVTKSENDMMVDDGDASRTIIVLANYKLDTSGQMDSVDRQNLDKPEQIKVKFELHGEKGTNGKSPIRVGEYFIETEYYDRANGIEIYHLNADGAEETISLSEKGKVVITSVDEKTIKGEIDVTAPNGSVKGSFTADYERMQ